MISPCTTSNNSIYSKVYQVNYCPTISKAVQMTASRAETKDTKFLLQDMRNVIKDLGSTKIFNVIKTLAYSVFSKDDIASKSLSDIRSIHSGYNARLSLEQSKLHAIETIAKEKCPSLNLKDLFPTFKIFKRYCEEHKMRYPK